MKYAITEAFDDKKPFHWIPCRNWKEVEEDVGRCVKFFHQCLRRYSDKPHKSEICVHHHTGGDYTPVESAIGRKILTITLEYPKSDASLSADLQTYGD